MNDCSETVRIIDLKDLLCRVAQKWRSIVIAMIIIALIAAAYKGVTVRRTMSDETSLAKAHAEYEETLIEYEDEGKLLRQ